MTAAYSIAEIIEMSGVCRTTIYAEIKTGRLKVRKLGRRTLILADELHHWLSSLPVAKTEIK